MKGDVASDPYRLSETHDMFTSLTRILVKSATDLENRYWIPLMEQAVNVMYKLAESPDIICGDLIKKLAMECSQAGETACSQAGETTGEKENQEGDDDENPLDGK
jgi:condensin complex subunit 1